MDQAMTGIDWNHELVEQLAWHRQYHLRPRLDGLTDADYPMAALVLHISREVIHHGAEICLLRDLYRATNDGREELS